MTLTEHYDAATREYLTRLRFRNLTGATLDNYESVLRRFGRFLADYSAQRGDPADLDLFEVVEAWKERLLGGGAKESTVRQYLVTLDVFFSRATKRSFPKELRFAENPVDMDEAPKTVTRPYDELLADEQIVAMMQNAPPRFEQKALWARDYAILMVLLNTKMRNSELRDLRLSDLDFLHHEIVVQSGKGRKQRVLDMDDLTETALRLYLESGCRPAALSDDDFLFGTTCQRGGFGGGTGRGSEKWHPMTRQNVSDLVRRKVKAITGIDDIRSHDLRHIGSRICLNAGASVEQLQGELGHSSVAIVERYSGRLMQRRRRESAQNVLAARDAVAEQNKALLKAAQQRQARIKGA